MLVLLHYAGFVEIYKMLNLQDMKSLKPSGSDWSRSTEKKEPCCWKVVAYHKSHIKSDLQGNGFNINLWQLYFI